MPYAQSRPGLMPSPVIFGNPPHYPSPPSYLPSRHSPYRNSQYPGTMDRNAMLPPAPGYMPLPQWQNKMNQILDCRDQGVPLPKNYRHHAYGYENDLHEAIYLRTIGSMQSGTNSAAQQHQRQIYEQQVQQRNAALEHQLAQRRARKPTDRNIPEGVEDLVIGEGVNQYKELREVERKLDYAMMRKRLDIQDSVSRNVKRQKTMRIWISNTCENQAWQRGALDENSFDFNSGADSTFKVKVEGKILDEADDDDQDSDNEQIDKPKDSAKSSKKLSHYFKHIFVEYDKSRGMPGQNIDPGMQIEWKKTPQSSEFDCLEFTRKGDENMNVTINLVRDEQLERYRLSQALSGALDMEEADRAEVVMAIWEYVKAMGLQEDEERRHVRCDDRLRQVCAM